VAKHFFDVHDVFRLVVFHCANPMSYAAPACLLNPWVLHFFG